MIRLSRHAHGLIGLSVGYSLGNALTNWPGGRETTR